MEDEQSDRPSVADISFCASVLRRLQPSDLEDPGLAELLEAATKLFKRKFFKDKFGSEDTVNFLKNRINIDKKIAKLQQLEKIVTDSRESRKQAAETCGMNLVRKAKLEQIKAESAIAITDEPDMEPLTAIANDDIGRDDMRDIAVLKVSVDTPKVEDALAEGLGPKADFRYTCNMCRGPYMDQHHFYHQLCPRCAEMNWDKRNQTADMTGMVCVVTGGRVRIGYHIVLKLLRAGAFVLTTTRFPMDCAQRFSREEDFNVWQDRLEVVGPLELSNMRLVERFCDQLIARFPRIHVLVNNAAQTLTRSEGWNYRMAQLEDNAEASLSEDAKSLLKTPVDLERQMQLGFQSEQAAPAIVDVAVDVVNGETDATSTLGPAGAPTPMCPAGDENKTCPIASKQGALNSTTTSHVETIEPMWSEAIQLTDFPKGQLDESRQPLDLSAINSWDRRLCDVSTLELLQTLAANTAAPFIMCSRLASVLQPSTEADPYGHIINVSALEGKFSVKKKSKCHPHTNMAKAALNMLTHTSSNDLFTRRVLMNCVDTGWVTDMAPQGVGPVAATHATYVAPPLDEEDGAARVLDPIFSHLKDPTWLIRGKFFKNYFVAAW